MWWRQNAFLPTDKRSHITKIYFSQLSKQFIQILWLQWQAGLERWPFAWQLRNLFFWLRVKYTQKSAHSFSTLPALNAAQSLRLQAYCKLQGPIALSGPTKIARDMSLREGSHYVGDLLGCLYPRFLNQRFVKEFGDVNWIPAVPVALSTETTAMPYFCPWMYGDTCFFHAIRFHSIAKSPLWCGVGQVFSRTGNCFCNKAASSAVVMPVTLDFPQTMRNTGLGSALISNCASSTSFLLRAMTWPPI